MSASTYDLLATAGFGSSPAFQQDRRDRRQRRFDVEDLASVFMRLADGGTLLVEASWAAHRRDGDEFGITLYGTDGGAELIVDDYAPEGALRVFTDDGGAAVATTVPVKARPRPQGRRRAVRSRRSAPGDWNRYDGAGAAALARIVDACYRSAAEQREIRLDS